MYNFIVQCAFETTSIIHMRCIMLRQTLSPSNISQTIFLHQLQYGNKCNDLAKWCRTKLQSFPHTLSFFCYLLSLSKGVLMDLKGTLACKALSTGEAVVPRAVSPGYVCFELLWSRVTLMTRSAWMGLTRGRPMLGLLVCPQGCNSREYEVTICFRTGDLELCLQLIWGANLHCRVIISFASRCLVFLLNLLCVKNSLGNVLGSTPTFFALRLNATV